MNTKLYSRATSGIRGNSLIVNLPGSKKGSVECFEAIVHQLPHAIDLIRNSHSNIEEVHSKMAMPSMPSVVQPKQKQPHICPHKQKTVNFQVMLQLTKVSLDCIYPSFQVMSLLQFEYSKII